MSEAQPPGVGDEASQWPLTLSDSTRPNPARIYNAWLGGRDNFLADRQVAEQVARFAPVVVAGARANRAFLRRAVTHLARAGIGQFLDLGAGLPSAGNVHEIAQQISPASRVAYVDNDPVVLAHARALLACDQRTIALPGDIRDPAGILTDPALAAHLDFTRPIAVLLVAVLHFIRDAEDPRGIVAAFRDALPVGSHVVITHVADLADPDTRDGVQASERAAATRQAVAAYEELVAPFVLRTPAQIEALFTGLDLVPPGVVAAHRWKPDRKRPTHHVPVLAGIGRLPEQDPA